MESESTPRTKRPGNPSMGGILPFFGDQMGSFNHIPCWQANGGTPNLRTRQLSISRAPGSGRQCLEAANWAHSLLSEASGFGMARRLGRERESLEASCGSAENPLQPKSAGRANQQLSLWVISEKSASTRKWFSPKVGIRKTGYRPESGSVRSEAKPNVERFIGGTGCQQKALRLMIRLHSASLAKEFWEHTRTCC